jgi:diguanylate cyclase (GGDEF)-like protein
MAQPFLVLRTDGSIQYVNRAFAEQYGDVDHDFTGTNVVDYLHRDDVPLLTGALEYAQSDPADPLLPLVVRVVLADGTTTAVEVVSRNHQDDPAIGGILVNLSKVEDRTLLDTALQSIAANGRLDATFATLADYLFEATTSPGLIRWSVDGRAPLTTAGSRDLPQPLLLVDETGVWDRARVEMSRPDGGSGVVVPAAALSPGSRQAATGAGYKAVWITSVPLMSESGLRSEVAMWLSTEDLSPGRDQALDRVTGLVRLAMERSHAEARLTYAARHDPLTGLANRTTFFAQMYEHQNASHGILGVLYLDLDQFKEVNDTQGHAAGDAVLRVVAKRILSTVRPDDQVARLGGDELAVLCPHLADADEAGKIADRLIAAIGEPITVEGLEVTIGVSIGISTDETAGSREPDRMLRTADRALYRAKAEGRNTWRLAEAGA